MARTKEFDPDKELKIAVNVFWHLGYEHTSLETLMREMGISKQSLYDTFGDKRSIYFQAMSRYRDDTNAFLRKLFAKEKSVRRGFAKPGAFCFRNLRSNRREFSIERRVA